MEPKLAVPTHLIEQRNKLIRFVETHVYELEARLEKSGEFGGGMGTPGLKEGTSIAAKEIKRLQELAKKEGLWALGHPKEIGGQGMPMRDYIYMNEVQGRSELAPLVLGTHSLQDSLMLYRHAPAAIKEKYLPGMVNADIYPSFAMTEPDVASSDPTQMKTFAKLDPQTDEWVINGVKWWTTNAANAAFTSVMVRTEFDEDTPLHASFTILVVPTDTPGYNILRSTHVLGVEGADHSEVAYNNVRIPKENVIGKRGAGFLIAQERLGPGRLFHCMRFCGQCQRGFDLMCQRLVERKVRNGKALATLQLMQQHVFDSYCDIQALRLLTLSAAEKMDRGESARVELSAAKAWGARAYGRVMDRAVQVFGAKGLSDDTPLSSMYRMSRAGRVYDGPDEVHVTTVGRLLLREYELGNRYDFSISSSVPGDSAKL